MKDTKQKELRARARQVIPNGMYGHESVALLPEGVPQFFTRAKGPHIWDADGNRYLDLMCAYGPNLLGYQDPQVEAAADAQRLLGDTSTGPSEIMVTLAEDFVGMISHADWAMFCKNGSDATSMAMVSARAYRGRRKILVAKGAYHGAQPWNTPGPAGILAEDRAHIIQFAYNDLDSLRSAIRGHENDIAGIFATPFRHEAFADQSDPVHEYAAGVRAICDELDALLIVDEVRAGFRLSRDSTWSAFGVKPDLSSWGKVLGNGYPLSALLGAEKVREAAGSIYATGSYWFSAVPMAAGVETLRQVRETDYLERIVTAADIFREGVAEQADRHGIGIRQSGPAQMPQILFEDDHDLAKGFAWVREAMEHGLYLHPWHNMFFNAAMTPEHVSGALDATEAAFLRLRKKPIPKQTNPYIMARLAPPVAAQ